MADDRASLDPETESRLKRQALLDEALEAFPTPQTTPFLERYELYKELIAGRDDPPITALHGMLTSHLASMMRRWRRLVDDQLRRQGHSLVRWHALFELSVKKPDETLTSLAMRVGVASAALVGLLDELEREGLILRTVDENDRRSKLITLTRAGEEAVSIMHDCTVDLRQEFLRGVTESEMRLMLDIVRRMNGNLDGLFDLR